MTLTERIMLINFLHQVERKYRAWGEIDNANQAHTFWQALEDERLTAGEPLSSGSPASVGAQPAASESDDLPSS